MTYIKRELVMLPTNEKVNEIIVIDSFRTIKPNMFIIDNNNNYKHEDYKAQHLYILSDEEIKEGDYGFDTRDNLIYQMSVSDNDVVEMLNKYSKKIIACTDSSLRIGELKEGGRIEHLPQIPQSFIEDFVEQYNLGNIITKVMVEYEPKRWIRNPRLSKQQDEKDFNLVKSTEDYDKYLDYGLKINDNTINVKPIKDSWSREEVIELLKKFDTDSEIGRFNGPATRNKWIEENL